jgi:hypothetical protein
MSDLEKVARVRDWVYANTHIASNNDFMLKGDDYPKHDRSLYENFLPMFEMRGGLFCSGIAFLLYQVYQALGFTAGVLDFGDPQTVSHSVTMVRIAGQVFLQDAYFNLEYQNEGGEPLSTSCIYQRLADGNTACIGEGDNKERYVHFGAFPTGSWTLYTTNVEMAHPIELGPKHIVCKCRTSIQAFSLKYYKFEDGMNLLGEQGYPRNMQFFLLHPYGVYEADRYISEPSESMLFRPVEEVMKNKKVHWPMSKIKTK